MSRTLIRAAAIAALALLAALLSGPPVAAAPQAGGGAPAECPMIAVAGSAHLYRREDAEMGKIIYMNDYGFIFAGDW